MLAPSGVTKTARSPSPILSRPFGAAGEGLPCSSLQEDRLQKNLAFPHKCLLRNRRHRSPATRCGRGELAPSPINDPVPKARRHQRTASGMPPVRRLRRPILHGTRAERDLRVRGRYGSAGVWGREPYSQASPSRSPPSLGPMDLPGPSACVGRDPLSHKAKGVLTGAWGDERHRSVRAQSRRLGGLGVADCRSRLLLRVPLQLRARSTRRSRAWLRGGSKRAGNGPQVVSCTGLRGASREIASSSMGSAASARNPALNTCSIHAIQKEPPRGQTACGLSSG